MGTKKDKSGTKCWTCANALGGCSWSRRFKPVRGWKATPTLINTQYVGGTPSFEVHECPEYRKG